MKLLCIITSKTSHICVRDLLFHHCCHEMVREHVAHKPQLSARDL